MTYEKPISGYHGDNDPDRMSDFTHIGATWLTALLLVTLLVIQTAHGRPASLQLHFNAFALLSMASLISNVIAFVLIMRIKRKSEVLVWFSAFLLSIATWAAGEMMARFSATPAAAAFWSPLSTPGSVFMPVTLYMFTLAYTRPRYALQPLLMPLMAAVAVLFVYIDNHGQLLTLYSPTSMSLKPWGYVSASGAAYGLLSLWAIVPPAACLALLYRFRKQTIDRTLRKQAQLFMWAIAIPLIGGSITDGILPTLGLEIAPPLSVMLLTVMGAIISYGVFKYRFFTITPSLIANEILGTMNEAVLGVEPNLRINFVNTGAEHLFDLPAKELSGKRLSDFWNHHANQVSLEDKLLATLGQEKVGTIESEEFHTLAGATFAAKVSITKLNDETQPYGYLVVMTDITALAKSAAIIEHKVKERTYELRAEQAKLNASIDSLPLGFMLIDEHEAISVQNRALQAIFNLDQPAKTVTQIDNAFPTLDLAKACMKVHKNHKPSEIKEISVEGKILHFFLAPVHVQDHNKKHVIGTVVLVEDVTEEKVFARSRDEFFSIASHELRTPLTAIKGNTSIMLQYYKKLLESDPSFRNMVYDIHTSSNRLIELVNDFLDVSRIEQGKMTYQMEAVAVDKIIESVFYEIHTLADGKKISLTTNTKTLGELPKAWADQNRLTQIIYNLVGNAVKFTDKGGVSLEAAHDGKLMYLRISDTGRGIALDNHKLLFHKFQQAGNSILSRDTTQGTGLGLYISNLMAQSMGGSLELEKSVEGEGSTFLLTLPIATKEQIAHHQKVRPIERIDTATGLPKSA